jgi:hypothetical protein
MKIQCNRIPILKKIPTHRNTLTHTHIYTYEYIHIHIYSRGRRKKKRKRRTNVGECILLSFDFEICYMKHQ